MAGAPSGTTIEQTDGTTNVLSIFEANVTLQGLEITGGNYAPSAGAATGGRADGP